MNEKYKRWRARYRASGQDRWLTVTSPDGTKAGAIRTAKEAYTAPPYWLLEEVRPVWSTILVDKV